MRTLTALHLAPAPLAVYPFAGLSVLRITAPLHMFLIPWLSEPTMKITKITDPAGTLVINKSFEVHAGIPVLPTADQSLGFEGVMSKIHRCKNGLLVPELN